MTEIQKKTKKILKREDLEQGYLGSILTAKDLEAKSTKHGSYWWAGANSKPHNKFRR
jgi:hypothetical protein